MNLVELWCYITFLHYLFTEHESIRKDELRKSSLAHRILVLPGTVSSTMKKHVVGVEIKEERDQMAGI